MKLEGPLGIKCMFRHPAPASVRWVKYWVKCSFELSDPFCSFLFSFLQHFPAQSGSLRCFSLSFSASCSLALTLSLCQGSFPSCLFEGASPCFFALSPTSLPVCPSQNLLNSPTHLWPFLCLSASVLVCWLLLRLQSPVTAISNIAWFQN